MARMSIDDSVLRDPRVKKLARSMGWSRRETIGALLDVWAVCYDRVSSVLSEDDINLAAESDQFCAALVTSGLAKGLRGTVEGYRLAGVEDRIGYLESSKESGRKGGVKSGESRRRVREGTLPDNRRDPSSDPQGSTNPSALPSASAPDVPSASVSASALQESQPANDTGPVERRKLAKTGLTRLNELRRTISEELGLSVTPEQPFQVAEELQFRLREAGTLENAEYCLDHVLRILEAEARSQGTLRWMTKRAFEPEPWSRALGMTVEDAARPKDRQGGGRPVEVIRPRIKLAP